MASQMVVPASKDTLFMRGFSARQNIDTLRDFFTENGGPCTVEFFKESEDKNKLYVALRFDTKDVAKEVLNRYDNKEVLQDRITISWFKDLRRARAKEAQTRRSFSGGSGWTDRSPENYYGNRQGQYGQFGRNRQYGGREYGGRSSRRDRSTSHSRSRSRSYSRDRSGSLSPVPEKRNRSRSRSEDSRSARRRSVSMSEESPVKDPTPQRSRRALSPERVQSRHESSPSEGIRGHPDDSRSMDRAPLSHRSHSPAPKGKPIRSTVSSVHRVEARAEDPPSEPDRYQDRGEFESRRGHNDDSYLKDRRPEPQVKEDGRKIRAEHSGEDYLYENNYDNKNIKRSYSPEPRRDRGRGRGEDERHGVADYPDSPPVLKEEPPIRKDRQLEDYVYRSDEMRGQELRGRGGPPTQEPRDWVQPPRSPGYQDNPPPRRKRGYEDSYEQDFDNEMKRTKRYADDIEPPRGVGRDPYDERSRVEKGRSAGRAPPRGERDRSPFDDRQSLSSSHRGANFNGNMSKEVERGALGLPHDKMIMVREKKEEIEKSYRQDCETFAAVTKMLISKDCDLEDKLQHSLRDNLQDIGQRCIHELREFIDKLKTEEGM